MKTVLLLRHADFVPPPGPAPVSWPLNAAGNARAAELVHVVGAAGITAVFASRPSRRKAALDVLRVVWVRRGRSSRGHADAGGNRDASGGNTRDPS